MGLPVTTPGTGVADVHGVRVHDPGHRLRVRVDVGCRDVLLRADEDGDLGRVAARQAFQLLAARASWDRTMTPPLPPPYGMPTTAHFQVIHMASALTSSSVTPWW